MDSGVLNLRAKTSTLDFLFRKLSGVGLMKSEATTVNGLSIGLVQGLPKRSSGFIYEEEFDVVTSLVVSAYSWQVLGSMFLPS